MTRKFTSVVVFALLFAAASRGGEEASALDFKAGADLRIRQEFSDNVPGLPGGGLLSRSPYGGYRNHMRYRVRAWGEVDFGGNWRIYTRLTDEFRWNVRPRNHKTTFPDEAIIDNLFIEAKDLFDGFVDFKIGRQDIYNLYGLDHVFVDGTPGDGSRTIYSDVARAVFKFEETGSLDVFALYNKDDNPLRWGTRRGHHRSLSGLGGGAETDMDDWGYGAVWSSKAADWLPYQLFAMQKRTSAFHRGGEKHPATRRSLLGAKLVPRISDELSAQFEGMVQIGRNSDDDMLAAWSAYSGLNWRKKTESSFKPFASAGIHMMSGDKNAADEDGGHRAWDPMWSRGVNDSEMFLYGTHYGAAWWSNMMFFKLSGGMEFAPKHRISASTGPVFAEEKDGLGGGDGMFKGLLSQARYDFPLWTPPEDSESRFEIVGHIFAELFNPGDYFDTDRPGWFLRWQVEFKF